MDKIDIQRLEEKLDDAYKIALEIRDAMPKRRVVKPEDRMGFGEFLAVITIGFIGYGTPILVIWGLYELVSRFW